MVKNEWLKKGYVDEPISADINLAEEIRKICKEKNAVVLAHYYTDGAVQDVADFVGDSLALARKARSMARTWVKLLSLTRTASSASCPKDWIS